jgi:hypothetical protein
MSKTKSRTKSETKQSSIEDKTITSMIQDILLPPIFSKTEAFNSARGNFWLNLTRRPRAQTDEYFHWLFFVFNEIAKQDPGRMFEIFMLSNLIMNRPVWELIRRDSKSYAAITEGRLTELLNPIFVSAPAINEKEEDDAKNVGDTVQEKRTKDYFGVIESSPSVFDPSWLTEPERRSPTGEEFVTLNYIGPRLRNSYRAQSLY